MAADVVDVPTRRRMMAGIRGSNTRPELLIRKGLHHRGYRYRLYARNVEGRPDLVFASRKAVIFVHGCFWHAHGCHLFKWPSTRPEFWKQKIGSSVDRDFAVRGSIASQGWRQLRVWECALKGKQRKPLDSLLDEIEQWLNGNVADLEIRGASWLYKI